MMKRILRIAGGFEEAAELDRRDVAAMSFEERISCRAAAEGLGR